MLPGGEKAASVAVGGEHTIVLTKSGTVWTCGADDKLQLGQVWVCVCVYVCVCNFVCARLCSVCAALSVYVYIFIRVRMFVSAYCLRLCVVFVRGSSWQSLEI